MSVGKLPGVKRIHFVVLGAVLLGIGACPIPLVVARNCVVKVIGSHGEPLTDFKVSRGWAYGPYGYGEELRTAKDGTVKFASHSEWLSLFRRLYTAVTNLFVQKGDSHIYDEYVIDFPPEDTAQIDTEYSTNFVYDAGHVATIDLAGEPADQETHRIRFIVVKKVF